MDWMQKIPTGLLTTLKFGFIGFLSLLMLIPLAMVDGVMNERQGRSYNVIREIAAMWGDEQVVTGPVLSVPYRIYWKNDDGKAKSAVKTIRFLPDELDVSAELLPDTKKRGIFKSIVYTSPLKIQGHFGKLDFASKKIPLKNVIWEDAYLSLGISDIKGIKKRIDLNWNGEKIDFIPGTKKVHVLPSGMHAPLPKLKAVEKIPFSIDMELKGTSTLRVVPVGKENHIELSSAWPDPSFLGVSPDEQEISDEGFRAVWETPYFSRNFPQIWTSQESGDQMLRSVQDAQAGVELLMQVDFYRKCERAGKYGILFLALTFLTYFLFEVVAKIRVHAFQYTLVGLSLCLFFLLLVSMSEFFGFLIAYIAASVPTIAVITLYTRAFTRMANKKLAGIMALILIFLYTYLYVLLQLEDMSLLFGAVGLFIALALVMYVTRNIDWYGGNVETEKNK